jgi:hypothetical protein
VFFFEKKNQKTSIRLVLRVSVQSRGEANKFLLRASHWMDRHAANE